jgi:hypothetical protein
LIRVTRMVERASTMSHELSTNSARLSVSKSLRFQRQNCS